MHVVHLTASTMFGGPERQMLGLADALPGCTTTFVSFSEGGRCRDFLRHAADAGHAAVELERDTPRLTAAVGEVGRLLRDTDADVLLCHGYKANVLGRPAARRAGIGVVAVARGWTAENLKVRCYELLDRWHLRWMDRVVCVSNGQAAKVRRAGVPARRAVVIRNAARLEALSTDRARARRLLLDLAPAGTGPVVVAAGRLSPEKGFPVFVEAVGRIARPPARRAASSCSATASSGPGSRRRSANSGSAERFVLGGFRRDLDALLPGADVVVPAVVHRGAAERRCSKPGRPACRSSPPPSAGRRKWWPTARRGCSCRPATRRSWPRRCSN